MNQHAAFGTLDSSLAVDKAPIPAPGQPDPPTAAPAPPPRGGKGGKGGKSKGVAPPAVWALAASAPFSGRRLGEAVKQLNARVSDVSAHTGAFTPPTPLHPGVCVRAFLASRVQWVGLRGGASVQERGAHLLHLLASPGPVRGCVGSGEGTRRPTTTTLNLTLTLTRSQVARYHATVDAMELAYITRRQPLLFSGKVEVAADADGGHGGGGGGQQPSLLVFTERRRLRVPLSDRCATPLCKPSTLAPALALIRANGSAPFDLPATPAVRS